MRSASELYQDDLDAERREEPICIGVGDSPRGGLHMPVKLSVKWLCPIVALLALVAPGSFGSARSADLGDSCCTDLEERIAELEATTARKGNRKVSLTLSGWVHQAIFFWDDGTERNAYIGTNTLEMTRLRFTGDAKLNGDWSAGYVLELGFLNNPSGSWDQDSESVAGANELLVRRSNWYLKSKTFGRFLVGLEGTPTFHLLGDPTTGIVATRYYDDGEAAGAAMSRFFIKSGGSRVGNNVRWSDILGGINSGTPGQDGRLNEVRYDTPEIMGFTANVAWGEDDFWGASLSFKKDFSDFHFQAKGGYAHNADSNTQACNRANADLDCEWWGIAAVAQHIPTGLFVYGVYGQQNDPSEEQVQPDAQGTDTTWLIQGGIEKAFVPLGKTTLYGEYRHDDAGSRLTANFGGAYVHNSDIDFWSAGVIQGIDAAAMDIYAIYRHAAGDTTNANGATLELDDFDMVITGARIVF